MASTAAVLVCALGLLGRSAASMPPIEIVATPPAGVSENADGFVRSGDDTIYVIASSGAYSNARCNNRRSLVKLASVLVHEQWHIRHGSDERGAYDAQLLAILLLGERLDSPVYRSVYLSMRSVLQAQKEENARRAQGLTSPEHAVARR